MKNDDNLLNVVSGVLVVDKPIGMTSHDVVQIIRRGTGIRRAERGPRLHRSPGPPGLAGRHRRLSHFREHRGQKASGRGGRKERDTSREGLGFLRQYQNQRLIP